MKTNWQDIKELPALALENELSRVQREQNKVLPYVGKLRHRAKILATGKDTESPLTKARDAALKAGLATSCVDNAKPFEVVFATLVLMEGSRFEESIYDALTYRQALTLAKACALAARSPAAKEAIVNYLTKTKFRPGFEDTLLEKVEACLPATPPPPLKKTEETSEGKGEGESSESSPSAPENVIPLPPTFKTAQEAFPEIKRILNALPDKQREALRAMLARLVNDAAKFQELLAA